MDRTFFLIALAGVIVSIGIVAINLWIIIPKALQFLETWRKNKNPQYFSGSVFCFFSAFSLFSLVLKLMIKSSLQIENLFFFRFRCVDLAVSLLMAFLLIYILIPKTLLFFEKWRFTKKTRFFSLSILFAFISTYIMLLMYILNTPVFLR